MTDPWPRLSRFQEHDIDLPVGTVKLSAENEAKLRALLDVALDHGNGVVRMAGEVTETLFSVKRACPNCDRNFDVLDPRLFSFNSRHGWCESCFGTGQTLEDFDDEQTGEENWWLGEENDPTCPSCSGKRLRPEALAVRFQGRTIDNYSAMTIEEAEQYFSKVKLSGRAAAIARDILPELKSRLHFLKTVGLAYLTLDRSAPSLSGGEAQRIRLAAQLGSNLRGVCYILDEPTIGLHTRDNRKLLETLKLLEQKGNTVVVVEHDEDTIRQADHVIDLGPGAGVEGGHIVAAGTVKQLVANKQSITGQYLAQPLKHPLVEPRPVGDAKHPYLNIKRARLNNLVNLNARIPLQRFVCVTGVSGSGKSTLVRSVVHDNLEQSIDSRGSNESAATKPLHCETCDGLEHITRILEVDQTPIGKTPRSCPATYVGFWTHIRQLFHGTTEANVRGYGPERFSFNVKGGRCEICEGQGMRKIEMSFLPDVRVPCEGCQGARFNRETLEVEFRGKNVGEVLAMSVDEATEFFAAHRTIHHSLKLLQDVGLGYLTLGQQSPTLSGGEAQRIKLVTELSKAKPVDTLRRKPRPTLYLLDEPTIGLHMADVERFDSRTAPFSGRW